MKLDSNGYAPSILPTDGCYICGIQGDLVRHEVFGGSRRKKSKELGLWVTLCPSCHRKVHDYPKSHTIMKHYAQSIAMRDYGWSTDDFIKEFGRNY